MEMEFEGLDELIQEFEKLSSEAEMDNIDKKVLNYCADIAHKEVKRNIWVSSNHSKSGPQHKGNNRDVPSSHAKDNIPISNPKKKGGKLEIIVGWEKSDNSEFFYTKFKEWGTSKMPPMHVFGGTNRKLFSKYEKIAIEEYEKEFKKRVK